MKLTGFRMRACAAVVAAFASMGALAGMDDSLQSACLHSNRARITALVKAGANPNGEGSYRGAPLSIAIENDDASLVRLLLAKGADPNYGGPDGRCGPLWHAFDASLPILRSLLAAGANPNCVWADKTGGGDQSLSTPLMAAASMKGLRRLHKGGGLAWTDRPARKDTPQPADVIKLLLKFGAKPNTRSYFGTNALYHAIDADDVDAARALIEGGLDVNSTIDASMPGEVQPLNLGQTALMHALGRYDLHAAQAGKEMIGMLLEQGADPDVPPQGNFISDCSHGTPPCSFSGETPLSYSARLGYEGFARLLLEHGAKPDGARADGAKPAAIAAQAGHMATAALITRYERRPTRSGPTGAPDAASGIRN